MPKNPKNPKSESAFATGYKIFPFPLVSHSFDRKKKLEKVEPPPPDKIYMHHVQP
jgi:hypothetical protein